jgi:hypothetical protein
MAIVNLVNQLAGRKTPIRRIVAIASCALQAHNKDTLTAK